MAKVSRRARTGKGHLERFDSLDEVVPDRDASSDGLLEREDGALDVLVGRLDRIRVVGLERDRRGSVHVVGPTVLSALVGDILFGVGGGFARLAVDRPRRERGRLPPGVGKLDLGQPTASQYASKREAGFSKDD